MSLERCQVRHVQIQPHRVMVPGESIFSRTAVPDFALGAYRDLVPAMNLRCLPTLVALEHANGYGGFYVDGVIAFGVADLERLADHISSYFPVIPDEQLWWFQIHAPHRLITPKDRLRAATTALLAHELGHAWGAGWEQLSIVVRSTDWCCSRSSTDVLPHVNVVAYVI